VSAYTAYHEAGHGVIARLLGSPKARLWLGDDDGVNARWDGGRCLQSLPLPKNRNDLPALRNLLVMTFAGKIAERIAAGRPTIIGTEADDAMAILTLERALDWRRDGSMAANAYKWTLEELAEMLGDELAAYHAWDRLGPDALQRAVKLVQKHWNTIERVAERLETEREILI
jgi:hypothetical protein